MNFNLIRFLDRNIGIPLCYTVYAFKKLLFLPKPRYIEPKRILIVKLWGIGSMIIASPAFRAIREKFPDAHITFLTLKQNEGVYEGLDLFDDIIYFDLKDIRSVIPNFIKTVFLLRKKRFDLALDFEIFAKFTPLLLSVSGVKSKYSYYTEKQGRSMLYDKTVVYNNRQHVSESFFDLVRLLDIEPRYLELEKIPFSEEDKTHVDNLLKQSDVKESDKLIGINVNASDFGTARRWSYKNFAELADRIIEKFKAKIVFVGANFDRELVNQTIKLIKNKGAIDLSGKTTIKQLAYLIQRFDLLITNDSGPMHIAVAMDTPVVAFFGPETPLIYGPLSKKHTIFYKYLPCSPCLSVYNAKRINCEHDARCMKLITVDEVMNKVEDYLK